MPRIIKSSGVVVQRARPQPQPPAKPRKDEPAPETEKQEHQAAAGSIYDSAEAVAENILGKARSDADNMLVDARRETIRILQDAMREGWERGAAEAEAQAEAARAEAEAEIASALEDFREEHARLMQSAEPQVLALVFDIVDKVLGIEMDRSEAWVEALVHEAMQELETGGGSVMMKVAARARERVSAAVERMLAASGSDSASISVSADPSLPPGGCVITTEKGSVETSAENKLARLKAAMKGA